MSEGYSDKVNIWGFDIGEPGDAVAFCDTIKSKLPESSSVTDLYQTGTSQPGYNDFYNLFNSEANILYGVCHGSREMIGLINDWGVTADDMYNSDHISGLYFMSSCYPGDFSINSVASSSLISPEGGTISFIAPSGLESPVETLFFQSRFFSKIVSGSTLGRALQEAKTDWYNILYGVSRDYYFGYNLLGDPTNKILFGDLTEYNISFDNPGIGTGCGKLTGRLNADPEYPVTITILSNNEVIKSEEIYTDIFSINYENIDADSVKVFTWSQNSLLKEYNLTVSAPFEDNVQIDSIKIIDESGDEILQNGEKFSVEFNGKYVSEDNNNRIFYIYLNSQEIDKFNIQYLNFDRILWGNSGENKRYNEWGGSKYISGNMESKNIPFEIIVKNYQKEVCYTKEFNIRVSKPEISIFYIKNTGPLTYKPVFYNSSDITVKKAKIKFIFNNQPSVLFTVNNIPPGGDTENTINVNINKNHFVRCEVSVNDSPYGAFNTDIDNINKKGITFSDYRVENYIDKFDIKWDLKNLNKNNGYYRHNIYLYNENRQLIKKLNDLPVLSGSYTYYPEDNLLKYVRISIIDDWKNEYSFSDYIKLELQSKYFSGSPLKLSDNAVFTPYINNHRLICSDRFNSFFGVDYKGSSLIKQFTGRNSKLKTDGWLKGYAVGDVNGDMKPDMVTFARKTNENKDSVVVSVTDTENGNVISRATFFGFSLCNPPVLVNSDSDSEKEILFSVFTGSISSEKQVIVYHLDLNGNTLQSKTGYPLVINDGSGYYTHSPSILDLNNDGIKELVVTHKDQIKIYKASDLTLLDSETLSGYVMAPAVFSDLDNNSNNEIVLVLRPDSETDSTGNICSYKFENNNLTALWNHDIEVMNYKSEKNSYDVYGFTPPPVIADYDDDNEPEIICLTGKKLYLYNKNGYKEKEITLEKEVVQNNVSQPSIADFDGDNILDVLFIDDNEEIWCYSLVTDQVITGFPIKIADSERVYRDMAVPVKDLDHDNDLEIILGNDIGELIVLDHETKLGTNKKIFDQWRANYERNGLYQLLENGPVYCNFETGLEGSWGNSNTDNGNWALNNTGYESETSLKSGDITHSQVVTKFLYVDFKTDGTLSFMKKVSSESNYDYLRFYIDGVEEAKWSGEIDWSFESFSITEGFHTFKWEYTKDGSVDRYSDCAWIDNIASDYEDNEAPLVTSISGNITSVKNEIYLRAFISEASEIKSIKAEYTIDGRVETLDMIKYTGGGRSYSPDKKNSKRALEPAVSYRLRGTSTTSQYRCTIPEKYDGCTGTLKILTEDINGNTGTSSDYPVEWTDDRVFAETFESGGFTKNSWNLSGDNNWFIDSDNPNTGVHCSESGDITHVQSEDMSVTLNLAASSIVTFYKKTSSETNYDFLKFYINGVFKEQWSGNNDWSQAGPYTLSSGDNTLLFKYYKDGSVSSYSDCVWVDDIEINSSRALSGIKDKGKLPKETALMQNYPNPFNPTTNINYELSITNYELIDLSVYNAKGQVVRTLVNKKQGAGCYSVKFNASGLNSGLYFYRLKTAGKTISRKMMVIK